MEMFFVFSYEWKICRRFSQSPPLAQMNDGLLDVILFKPASLPEVVSLFIKVVKGEHLASPQIIYFQTNSLKIPVRRIY